MNPIIDLMKCNNNTLQALEGMVRRCEKIQAHNKLLEQQNMVYKEFMKYVSKKWKVDLTIIYKEWQKKFRSEQLT